MATEIVVPRLGWSMEEGVFGQWLHEPGTLIQPGDLLYVLEGEKAAQDIESFDGGVLHVPDQAPGPGETVRVGQILGYLLAAGEDPPEPSPAVLSADVLALPEVPVGDPVIPLADTVAGSASGGSLPLISPRARRIAAELGIAWVGLTGTGSRGRIREQDILAAAGQLAPGGPVESDIPGELKPTSRVRRTIARRLLESIQHTVPVTLVTRVDATEMVRFRNEARERAVTDGDIVPTYTDILARVVAESLVEYPDLHSQWRGQMLFVPKHVNLAFAVDSEQGLLAPVIHDVGSRSLAEIATESASLVEQVRAGSLREDALQGATFTITNLGMFGVEAFTPIISLPQCATLGVGQIKQEAVVVDGEVVVRDQLTLSLTFDHRVVDGAPAARFLARIRSGITGWSLAE
ncbi:MAG: dihydrolipoamide acetyltransferase family protein [Pirellulaceae bacterium]